MKFTAAEPDFVEMVKDKISGNHFSNFINLQVKNIEAGLIDAEIEITLNHKQQMGFVHGGVTATVADVVMGFAAYSLVKRGFGVVTSDLRISYLNPGIGDVLYSKGWVIKAGSRMHFCEAELWTVDANGKRTDVAKASGSMVVVSI